MIPLFKSQLLPDSHPALIERLRVLYEMTREYLATHPIPHRTPAEQQEWWAALDHSRVTVHLYSPPWEPWNIVAFSMVTDRGSFCTPQFAVDPLWWGHGYGEEIIEHYLSVAGGKPLHGEQLASNGAICYLNARNGWIVKTEANGVQYLYHPNGTNWPQSAYDEIIRYHLGGGE